jgi:hypothetical protein
MNSLKRYVNLLYKNKKLGVVEKVWVLTAAGIFTGMIIFPRSMVDDPKKKKGVFSEGLFSDDLADPSNAEDFTLIYVSFSPSGRTFKKGDIVQLSNTVISYAAVLAWGDDYSDYYSDAEPDKDDEADEK